jgi:hypothetical protein
MTWVQIGAERITTSMDGASIKQNRFRCGILV